MRFTRVLAALVAVAIVALGAAWRVSASHGSPRSRAVVAANRVNLERELQRLMATLPPRLPSGLPTGPGACFVTGGSCSLKPCRFFTGQPQPVGAAPTTPSTVALVSRPLVARDQIPASAACQGRVGTPHTFLVRAR